MSTIKCTLCDGEIETYATYRSKHYLKCLQCHSVMMAPSNYLSYESEKERYETHNNDIFDSGYRRFVTPIYEAVRRDFSPYARGLDYGAGTGPVLTAMLKEDGYTMTLYDPYFWKDPSALTRSYDFIVCCEVMEHFHFPLDEFQQLFQLLKPGGKLYVKTDFISADIDFLKWYYKDDPTHVFFYSVDALDWIRQNLGFSDLLVEGRIATFQR